MNDIEIRLTLATDTEGLAIVADETGLFPGDMLPALTAEFLGPDPQEVWLTCIVDGVASGFCFARPEALTDRTWNMLALAVLPRWQGRGLGAALVRSLENNLRQRGQRLLIADTSGTDAFVLTRRFYRRSGYEEAARIADFWAAGDDKVIFRKALI